MSRLEALLDRASGVTFYCEWDAARTLYGMGGRIAVCSDGCQRLVFCIDVPLSAPDSLTRPIATQI